MEVSARKNGVANERNSTFYQKIYRWKRKHQQIENENFEQILDNQKEMRQVEKEKLKGYIAEFEAE